MLQQQTAAEFRPQRRNLVRALLLASAAASAAVIALLVVLDPLLREHYPFNGLGAGSIPMGLPWLFAPALILIVASAGVLWLSRHWIIRRRYELALVVLMAPGALSGIHAGSFDAFDVVMLSLGAAWIGTLFVEGRPLLTPTYILTLLLGIAICAMASVVNGRGSTIIGLPSMINKLVLIVMLTNLVRTPRLLRAAVIAFVAIAAVSAVIALLSVGIYAWSGYELNFDDNEEFRYKEMPFGLMLRATALLSTPQGLGHLLILACAVVLLTPWRRWVRLGLAGLLSGGLIATFSTGAYLVLASIVILSVPLRKPAKAIHYGAVVLGGVLLLYVTGVLKWLYMVESSTGGDAANDRVDYTRVALSVIQHHPFAGIGLNNFGRALYIPVHNAYLQMSAEIGLIGGALFTTLVGSMLVRALLCSRCAADLESRLYLKGLALGMLAMVIQFFMEPLYINVVSWAFMGLVAGATALYWPVSQSRLEAIDDNDLTSLSN
jgi:O-antigen ligase